MTVQVAQSDSEILSCWDAISILRPMLLIDDFVNLIRTQQNEGYVIIYISENDKVVAVAGYRIMNMLYCGKIVYIDDLSTLENFRGKGFASTLLRYIYRVAELNHCEAIHLDSGTSRTNAHRLYFNESFIISAFHFNKSIYSIKNKQ